MSDLDQYVAGKGAFSVTRTDLFHEIDALPWHKRLVTTLLLLLIFALGVLWMVFEEDE